MKRSHYARLPPSKWLRVTEKLLRQFPIKTDDLVKTVLESWQDIFKSKIGQHSYHIGREIFPQPQIMGFLLHELIPLNLAARFPKKWRRGQASTECDAHCLREDHYSFEIKTSSSATGIFGNRSYAHVSDRAKKRRAGYMLAVNYAKFCPGICPPALTLIRFGWLVPSD